MNTNVPLFRAKLNIAPLHCQVLLTTTVLAVPMLDIMAKKVPKLQSVWENITSNTSQMKQEYSCAFGKLLFTK